MVILFFGPPGSGKGTQSKRITDGLHIPAISTGELFRAEIAAGTPLGQEVREVIASGRLVNDAIVNRLLENRLASPDAAAGFLLDGYPRTVPQAEFLDQLVQRRGHGVPRVLHLDVPMDILFQRLSGRRACPQCGALYNIYLKPPKVENTCDVDGKALTSRPDDREEVVRERLAEYTRWTDPVIHYYQNRDYHRVDGNRPAEAVEADVAAALAEKVDLKRGAKRAKKGQDVPV